MSPDLNSSVVYCTVVAENYLPQALALHASIREIEPDKQLVILVVDSDRRDLEQGRAGLRVETTEYLGLSRREVMELATIYDVVEFSTSVKPLFFKRLLEDFEVVVYLDPDMMVVTPLTELPDLAKEHGVVLTPHFLRPIASDITHITEGHDLTVGIYNLGFCAVGRAGLPFLDWWWSHLRRECLIYPLLGVFVDQKWVDIGANFFDAHSLKHAGYNVGPWNLHERGFEKSGSGYQMTDSPDSLRLMHFSGFNPRKPDAVSVRLSVDLSSVSDKFPGLREISRKYAADVIAAQEELGSTPEYGFLRASDGKILTKRTRRTYRKRLLDAPAGKTLPSPFDPAEIKAFRTWERGARLSKIALTFGDASVAAKYALPDEFTVVKKRLPGFAALRSRLLNASRVRR